MKLKEKVIKLDDFWDAVVMGFFTFTFSLKCPNVFNAKLN